MKENKIRRLLNEGKAILSTRQALNQPYVTEIAGYSGLYDYMEFLAEYGVYSQEQLENICRAAEIYDMGTMIKIDFQNRYFTAQKAIASGFQGLMFADHRTAEEVRGTVLATLADSAQDGGKIGFTLRRYIGEPAFVLEQEHAKRVRDVVRCFMIEKEEAVRNLEEICKVPGVDMVQFGGCDYCMGKGWNRTDHQEDLKAIQKYVIETALGCGVRPRCEINRPEEAEYFKELGVKDFSLGIDTFILREYWNEEGRKMRKIMGES